MGSVITTRPYYRRVAWDDAVDATSMETGYASNFVVATGGASGLPYTTSPNDTQLSLAGNQDKFAISTWDYAYPYAPRPAQHIAESPSLATYWLPGTYSTDQETLYNMIDWIDSVAKVVTGWNGVEWVGAYSIPATVTTDGKYFLRDAYSASYDVAKHDWS